VQVPFNEIKNSPPTKVEYRKDDNYAVWDSRGLSIRKGAKSRSTKLPDIPLTPKLFSREEIIRNRELIASGLRSKLASGVSGSRRIGDVVYFLPRWDQRDGAAWLEALIKVDLTGDSVESNLLGKFEGVSLSNTLVGDRLFLRNNLLCAITRKPDGVWGLASFDPSSLQFQFKPMGRDLVEYCVSDNSCVIAEQATTYGSKLLLRVNFDTGLASPLHEFRGNASVLTASGPCVARISTVEGEYLLNLESGSALAIPRDAAARAVQQRVLVWLPNAPEQAKLYEPMRWNAIAQIATAQPPPAHPPSHSGSRP